MFAKLFGKDENQILVKIDRNEKNDPEVRVYCEPKDFGVRSLAINFPDTEVGWKNAENAFNGMTEEKAEGMRQNILKAIGDIKRK